MRKIIALVLSILLIGFIIIALIGMYKFNFLASKEGYDIDGNKTVTNKVTCKNTENCIHSNEYIGFTVEAAQELAKEKGVRFRIVILDGKPQPTTRDYRPGRINAEVLNGKIISFKIEGKTETSVDLKLEKNITLFNFSERKKINSPLTLRGIAPRAWFFEGIIPITLLTLEEDIVVQSYGTGAWLEPLEGETELKANDPIEFTANITFTSPRTDLGKIRVAKDPTGFEETGELPQYVETIILWP